MSSHRNPKATKPKTGKICDPPDFDDQPQSYAEIVHHYRTHYQTGANSLADHYATLSSLDEAIEQAAFAKMENGKRHLHQYRLRHMNLQKVHYQLKRCDLRSCNTFRELFAMIDDAISGISGIGVLMVYDTAHRLGAHLKIEPESIHLHAGVRVGAAALGFKGRGNWIDPKSLPDEFHQLSAAEMEDCLCIYKVEI